MRPVTSQAHQRRPAAAVEVPERPSLAPNIQLNGAMQGSAFKHGQWLVQRDGQFIQLTELLYRIAEQVNGERTLEEIAAGVTQSTDWMVSADNVRQLIQSKLIPVGLIAGANGSTIADSGERRRRRSPLAVNMRQKTIGPRIIEPIAESLQVLYAPPVLVPILIVIVLAHGWLYLVHGLTNAIRDVLYNPALVLVLLPIMLAAAVFHEFGHASALKYGGGMVRGMGVGIYLIYPAIYTDVTDGYRLSRWARVRTDLGGFYFELIFALGTIAVYVLSRQEVLLLVVLLISLEMIRQLFLPFVRFDGYWLLADLTGIPDFFSQMGPFLRSVLPISRWKGTKLPDLKPWAKAVFAAYMIVTIPVLSLLLYLLVTHLPWVMATFWESLLIQAGAFSSALDSGDPFSAAGSIAQMSFLGLQALAITYLLYNLGRMLVLAIWKRIGTAHRPEGEGA